MKQAVILASGPGKRMWPFSVTQDKFLMPVAGRPLIAPLLEAMEKLDYGRIYLSISERGKQQFTTAIRKDATKFDLRRLRFVEDSGDGGCAASLSQILPLLPTDLEELLVCYGDIATPALNLERILEEHRSYRPEMTVLVQELHQPRNKRMEYPGDWICAKVENGCLQKILAHPRSGVTHRLGGMFVFSKKALRQVPDTGPYMDAIQVGMMPPPEANLAQTVANLLFNNNQIRAVEAQGYLVDVDKPWHLMEASYLRLDYLAQRCKHKTSDSAVTISLQADLDGFIFCEKNVTIGPRVKIRGPVWIGAESVIDNGATIYGPTWIGRNCRLEDYCRISPYTSIGRDCQVGHCAEIEGVLMEGVYALHYLEFYGVIGRHSDLGAATVCGSLRFDDGITSISVLGRREQPHRFSNAVYLGDFTRTGVNAILMPGLRVGPYSVVGAGVVLNEDVPERTMVLVEQSLTKRPWGPEKYGW